MNLTYLSGASTLCAVSAALFMATGCVSRTPYLDSHFGESVNLLKAQQTLNPQAALNTNPVTGMDGRAASSAYDQYQKSYKAPEPLSNSLTIGIGGR
jgi:hypothetical protein